LRGYLLPQLYLDGHLGHMGYERYRDTTSYAVQGDELTPTARLQGDDASILQAWNGKVQFTWWDDSADWQLQFGLESNSENVEGQRILGGHKLLRDEALFTSLRWNGSKSISLQGSLRLMDHSDFATEPTHSLQFLGKSRSCQWRASWSSGFRAPSAKELYLDFPMSAGPLRYHIHGNADLRPERGRHFAASWQGELARAPLHWRLEAFHNQVRDAIALSSLEADPLQANLFHRTYWNLEQHETFGGRLHLSHQGSRLQSGLSWAPTAKRELLAQSHAELASRRWIHDGQLDLAAGLPLQLAVQLSLTHRGSREAYVQQNGAPSLSRSESYQRLDLGFVRRFKQLEWRFGCKNLFDVTELDQVLVETGSAHASETIDWGRTYYTQLSLRSGGR
jgi:outer membrane receptor for ferrienterochelin and colicins